jgi:ribosomal protein S18 acetylase RimI-like enzyme
VQNKPSAPPRLFISLCERHNIIFLKGGGNMKIELATLNDLEAICALYEEFYAYHANMQPIYYKNVIESGRYPKSAINSEKSDIFIAVENNIVVGFALVNEQETPPYECFVPHKYAELDGIIVAPSYRSKGIGASLINAAKQWAMMRELDYIELKVLFQNLKAMSLYEQEGFQTVSRTMRFTL